PLFRLQPHHPIVIPPALSEVEGTGAPPLSHCHTTTRLSFRPERPDLLLRAVFWRVGPRSGGISPQLHISGSSQTCARPLIAMPTQVPRKLPRRVGPGP